MEANLSACIRTGRSQSWLLLPQTGLAWFGSLYAFHHRMAARNTRTWKKAFFFFSFFFFLNKWPSRSSTGSEVLSSLHLSLPLVINVHWRLILTILTFPLDESFQQSFNNFYKIFCNNYLVLSCNSPSSKNCFIHLFELFCYRKGLKGFPPSNNNLEYFFGFPFIMHPLKSQAKVRYLFENTPNSICRVITIHPRRQHRCYFW